MFILTGLIICSGHAPFCAAPFVKIQLNLTDSGTKSWYYDIVYTNFSTYLHISLIFLVVRKKVLPRSILSLS